MDTHLFLANLQCWFNIFYVFVLPVLAGIVLRSLLGHRRFAWLLTAVFGVLAAVLIWWVKTTPQYGHEGPSLLAVQLSLIAFGSLLTGLIH